MIHKNDYPVFQPNQVLSHDQLNDILKYLEPRDRATRSLGLGRGILCGLGLKNSGATLILEAGAALTSAGFLAEIGRSYTFRFAADFTDLSKYPAFLNEARDAAIPLIELFEEKPDDTDLNPVALGTLNLSDYIALLFLHDYEKDLATCLVDDCDNLGAERTLDWHVLLIKKDDAVNIVKAQDEKLATAKNQAELESILLARYDLAPLRLEKPAFLPDMVVNYSQISNNYHSVCMKEINRLAQSLDNSFKCFGHIIGARNLHILKMRLVSNFNTLSDKKGLQYFYDHLSDLFDAYNEFLDRAQVYYASCGWQQDLFSHHVMLGQALAPEQCKPSIFRHYFTEARVEYAHGGIREELVFLFDRMLAMISHFKLDTTLSESRITPEKQGAAISERAIPCYYDFDKISKSWSLTDSRFCRTEKIASYHNPMELLDKSLNSINHFRIEGHLYRKRDEVVKELETLRAQHNLAFKIQPLDLGELEPEETSGGCTLEEMRILYQLARLDCICFLEEKIRYLTNLIADDIDVEYKDEEEAQPEIERQKKPTPAQEALKLNYADVIDFSQNSLFETQAIISEIIARKGGGTPPPDDGAQPVDETTPATPGGLTAAQPYAAAAYMMVGGTTKSSTPITAGAKDASAYGISGPKKSKYEAFFQEEDLEKESLPEGIKYITGRKSGIVAAKASEDFAAAYGKGAAAAAAPIKENSTSLIVEAANIAMVFPKTRVTDYFNFTKPALADRLLQELIGLMTKVLELLPVEAHDFDEEAVIESCGTIKDKAMTLQEIVEDLLKNEKYIVKGFEFGLISEMLEIVDSCLDERLKNIAELHQSQWEQASNSTIFSEFIRNNPGIEHRAGVPKGGTFILVSGTIDKEKKKQFLDKYIIPGKYMQPLANYQVYRGNIYEKMLRTASHFSPKAFTWTKLIDKERATATTPLTTVTAASTKATSRMSIIGGDTKATKTLMDADSKKTADVKVVSEALSLSPAFNVSTLSIIQSQKKLLEELLKKIDSDPDEMVLFDFCLPYFNRMCSEIKYVVLAELKLYLPKESFCAGDSNSYAFAVYPPGGVVSGTGVKKVNETYYFVPASAVVGEVIFTYTIGGHEVQLATKVHPQPTAAFSYQVLNIDKSGAEVEFTNLTTNAETYAWNFGDGKSSEDHSPVHTFDLSDQNLFTVSLTAASGADCVDVAKKEINLVPINFHLAVLEKDFCATDETFYDFVMEPADGVLSGDGVIDNQFNPAAIILDNESKRTVTVSYTVDEQTATTDLTVFAQPTVDFTSEVIKVTADSATVKFTTTANNASVYFWDFGDTGKATTADTQHTFKLSGGTTTFTVSLTAQNGPCTVTVPREIDLSPITFNLKVGKSIFCANNNTAYSFNVAPAGGTISGPGIEADKFKPSLVDVGAQTSRTVTLQYTYGTQTAIVKVTVYHAPELKFSHKLISQDRGFGVQFTNLSSYATDYVWDFGDGSQPLRGFSPSHTFMAEGLYTVTLKAANPGCTAVLPQQILLKKSDLPVNDKMIPPEPVSGLIKLLQSTLNKILYEFGMNPGFIIENHAKVLEVNAKGGIAEFAENDTFLVALAKEYIGLATALVNNYKTLPEKQLIYMIQVYKLAMAVLINILSRRSADLKPAAEIGAMMNELLELTVQLNKLLKITMVFTENFILQPPEAYKGKEMLEMIRKGLGENL